MSRSWQNGFFDCFSNPLDCLLGCFVPCHVYGEADYRLHHEADPQASQYNPINSPCALFYLLSCPTCGIYPAMKLSDQRADIRNRAGIEGSSGVDFGASCCLGCCVAIQNKHEIEDMVSRKGAYSSMGAAVQPGVQQGMSYGQDHKEPYVASQAAPQQQQFHSQA